MTMTEWPWRDEFDPRTTYLDTAMSGLPPRRTVGALTSALDRWSRGEMTSEEFDPVVDDARAAYARLVGVGPSWVAIGNQVSPLVGIVASSIPDGARVLVPEGDFASVPFPFAAQAHRSVTVTEVPFVELANAIDDRVTHVAFSLVQSATGAVADVDAVVAAAARVGARTLVDTTQAAGWFPVDASRFDWTVCSAYKWLLGPRGTAFLTVRPDRVDELIPVSASWYGGEPRWSSLYGLPLRLSADARRFDVSPAWHAWVGTRASLSLLEEVGVNALHRHALECEYAFADAAGLEPTGSAITSLLTDDRVQSLLSEHRITAADRAGRLRLSFHVSTTVDQAVRVGELLRGHVKSS